MQHVCPPGEQGLAASTEAWRTKPGGSVAAPPPRPAPQPRARPPPQPESGCSGLQARERRCPSWSFPQSCYTRIPFHVPPSLLESQDSGSRAETYQGRESSRDGGKGRTEKTKSAACVSFSAGSARREEEAGPAPRPPLSFLYCDWKSEPRPPLPSARSVPFKDKDSNVPTPSRGPVERVTLCRLRRAPSQPVSWQLTDFSTQRLPYF